MSQQPQLNLRVVGGEKLRAWRSGKGGANFAAKLGACGNILQIWIDRRKPSCRNSSSIEGGVYAGVGVGQKRQRVNISRFQLGQMPEFQHQPRNLVLFRQVFQHILRRGDGLSLATTGRCGQVQIRKQHLAKLLGRVDVEAPPSQLEDLLADAGHLYRKTPREPVQHAQIDAHPGLLHAEENRRKLQIHCVNLLQAALFNFGLQCGNERPNRRSPRRERGRRSLRVARRHVGQRLRGVRWIQRIREQHRVVHRPAQRNSLRSQQMERGLPIVCLLGNGLVFQQCAQLLRHRKLQSHQWFCANSQEKDSLFFGRFNRVEQR